MNPFAPPGHHDTNRIEPKRKDKFGGIPPQAVELEEAVLGALMLEKGAIDRVITLLKPEYFVEDKNRKIYCALFDMYISNQPIDILTVTYKLKSQNALDENLTTYYLTQLTAGVGSAAHLEFHAAIVAQNGMARLLIERCTALAQKAYEPGTDLEELMETADKMLFDIFNSNFAKQHVRLGSVVSEVLKRVELAQKNGGGLTGIASGFADLDRVTHGWQASDMVVVAARPSMGKTAFVLNAAIFAAKSGRPTALFSLEMGAIQLGNRAVSAESEITGDKLATGNISQAEWNVLLGLEKFTEIPLFIDDTPAITLFELRSKCRRLKAMENIELVIIDYLQLMTPPKETRGNREQAVSALSRGIKAIAKELNLPIIVLSQLNRSVETRAGDKRPNLSDLRESGAIEQDADLVIFIHRPEKYGFAEFDDGTPTYGMAELIISKHRQGSLADVRVRFDGGTTSFKSLDSSEQFALGTGTGIKEIQTFTSKIEDNIDF